MSTHQDRAFDDLRNTLGEYMRIVRHRWKLALIGLGLVGSLGFWYSQKLPREYRAMTIFERRDDAVIQQLIQSKSPYSFASLKSSIVLDMTGSRALANAALDMGLLQPGEISDDRALSDRDLKRLDAAIGRYGLRASVRLMHSSANHDTIQLRCEANDPKKARQFTIALRDRYIQDSRDRITEILSRTHQFFTRELERYQKGAAATNLELRGLFDEFPGVDPTDPSSAGMRLTTLRQEATRLAQRQEEIAADIAAREQFLMSVPVVEVESDPRRIAAPPDAPPRLPETEETIRRAIQTVEASIDRAVTVDRKTIEHPDVKTLYRKLEGLFAARQMLRDMQAEQQDEAAPHKPKVIGEEFARWSAQKIRVELELDALRKQLAFVVGRFQEADLKRQRFEKLYAQLLEKGDHLAVLEQRLQEDAAIVTAWRQYLLQLNRVLAAESEQRGTQFALIEEPKEISRASSPRVSSVFAACIGFGLAAAALCIALAELLDRSFRSAGQVTRVLGVPVLASVGVIATPKEVRRRRLRGVLWTPTLGILVVALGTMASLAYTSLENPVVYGRAIAKIDRALASIGLPPTALSPVGKD
ncbi:MAG: hypothetical protein IH986_18150 [Planctomycetes bacterium]|nr:hypothetical protein [Planctomycetota bacterium]